MDRTKTEQSVSNDVSKGELYFTIAGFWDPETIVSFLKALTKHSIPIYEARKPIRALGDMSGFMAQDRETSEAIRNHLVMSQQHGLQRVAIIGAPSLVKIQYRRLSEGSEVEFFDNKPDALVWLRRD